jgi:hypothetical protein
MASGRRRVPGHIEQLPSGRFRGIVYTGIDPLTGQRRYLKESADDYDAARVTLTKLQRQGDEDATRRLRSRFARRLHSGSTSPRLRTRLGNATRT